VRATGALDATREAAKEQAQLAASLLSALPDSPAREALLQLSVDSISRSS
jgi:octaprenyl-diphosphate synthase